LHSVSHAVPHVFVATSVQVFAHVSANWVLQLIELGVQLAEQPAL
jgi:hypothetical protein